MNGLNLSENFLKADRQLVIVEDFLSGAPDEWTAAATSGTVAALDERGGVLSLTTQAADNAEGTLTLDSKIAELAQDKPLTAVFRIQFSEANTNAANVFVGLTSEAVATALGDNGAGPPASYSGVGFHKLDGGLNWITEFSVGSTQKTVELNAEGALDGAAKVAGNASYQVLSVEVYPKTSALCDVVFKIDGVAVQKFLDQTFTSIADMAPVIVIKAGSSTAEVLKTDFVKFAQVR